MELVLRTFPSHRVVAVALISLLPMSMTTFLLQTPGLLHSIHGTLFLSFLFGYVILQTNLSLVPLPWVTHVLFLFWFGRWWFCMTCNHLPSILFTLLKHPYSVSRLASFLHTFKKQKKWWCHLCTFSGPNLTILC